jgi:HEAT repeat protein
MSAGLVAGILRRITLDLVKRGYRKITEASPLYKAIRATIEYLPEVEARPSLQMWCESDAFVDLLEAFKAGDRVLTDESVVRSFIESTDFYMGDATETQRAAKGVIAAFATRLQDEIYNSPRGMSAFARREEALHERTHRSLSDIDRVLSERQNERSVSPIELVEAYRKVTERTACELLDYQETIVRDSIRTRIDEFLLSPVRYCFILGPTGVGKSIIMAQESQRLPGADWTALLVPGGSFSLDRTAALIGQELPRRIERLDWRGIVSPWRAGHHPISAGLAIFIDAVEEASQDEVARELRLLHEETGDIPFARFKIIVSCRDLVWSRFRHNRALPYYEDVSQVRRQSVRGSISLQVSDFKPDELDRALQMIGATELLPGRRYAQEPDPHVATLRDLLKHPGTFEHYASMHGDSDASSLRNLTWSGLIAQRIEACLEKAERSSGARAEILRDQLVRVAVLGCERASPDFQVPYDMLEEALPGMRDKGANGTHSAYDALLDNGVLIETSKAQAGTIVGFRITDAGAYLLSLELERQLGEKTPEDFHALVEDWVTKARNYYPMADAMLALMDRLAANPVNPRLLTLVSALVEEYHFHSSSVFRLVSPAIVSSIFAIIKQEGVQDYFAYGDAAIEMRHSPESLAVIRHHLRHPNPLARELAARLAGVHQDTAAAVELIELLEDAEDEVRSRAYISLSHIGKPAIPPLVQIITDVSQPPEHRASCLSALRGVGFRNDAISAAICFSVTNTQNSSSKLLQSAFLAAAHLRDTGHGLSAAEALRHEHDDVIEAAAKYLTEVPDPNWFDQLLGALRMGKAASSNASQGLMINRQLLAALFATDRERSSPVISEMVEEGLNGEGALYPGEAVRVAEKFGGPAACGLVLKHLVSELKGEREQKTVWWSAKMLGSTWKPDEICALVETAKDLEKEGVDLAQVFVNAILPGMEVSEEFPIGHQLNLVSDFDTAIRCQATHLIPEAVRLLRQAKVSARELCKLLWIAADPRAESELLYRLENPTCEGKHATLERASAVRALGTCSTARGAQAVLAYLRLENDISLYLFEQTLRPLLSSKLLSAQDLVTVAKSPHSSAGGKVASLLALACLDVRGHREVFADVAENTEEEIVQMYASRLLGFTRDASEVAILVHIVQTSKFLRVKSEAAKALARLNARATVHDIEHALEQTPGPGFIKALAHFRERSSVPQVVEGVNDGHGQFYRDYLRALGAFSKFEECKDVILGRFEEWVKGEPRLFDYQSPLIKGLVPYDPSLLLEQFNRFYDDGYINSSARQTLARLVPELFRSDNVERALLLGTLKRLVCDRNVAVREMAAYAIGQTDGEFCSALYRKILGSADEWSRSCAVYTLGFWDSDMDQIQSARYDTELLVRRSADAAWKIRENSDHLKWHIQRYGSTDGLERLSAYLCLREHGDINTIWQLYDSFPEGTVQHTFLRTLTHDIDERLRKEQRDRQDEQDKLEESRGTISFD